MPMAVTLPDGFGYVGAALMSTVWLLVGQNVIVGRYRGRAGIKYPQLYAEKAEAEASKDAYLFNCAQRAHQNTLENIPIIYTTAIISGLNFPVFTACATAFWTLSRISYTRAYLTGPQARGTLLYRLSYIGVLGMLLTSTYVSGRWALDGILKLLN